MIFGNIKFMRQIQTLGKKCSFKINRQQKNKFFPKVLEFKFLILILTSS
jgi:hypothetical protein